MGGWVFVFVVFFVCGLGVLWLVVGWFLLCVLLFVYGFINLVLI